MTRVLFVLPNLRGGGAERVVATLLQHLPRERFELHLALVDRSGELLGGVPDDVTVHDLEAGRVRRAPRVIIPLVRTLRPHVVFSTLSYMNLPLLALRSLFPRGTRLIAREATTLSRDIQNNRPELLWRLAYRWLYPRADTVVCPARSIVEDLAENFGVPRERMRYIPNPVDLERIAELAAVPSPYSGPGPHLVAIGRQTWEKGFDRAIRAFSLLATRFADADLHLVGDGPERAALEALARDLGQAERVHFTGFDPNPYRWLRHADAFVQCSAYEGLPNVLLESLACGTRAAAFDAPGGTRQILEGREGTRLVAPGDEAALASALEELIRPEPPPAPTLAAEYSLHAVVAAYAELLDET